MLFFTRCLYRASGSFSSFSSTSVPWRLASKFHTAQHRREAYLRVLQENIVAFQGVMRELSLPCPSSSSTKRSSIAEGEDTTRGNTEGRKMRHTKAAGAGEEEAQKKEEKVKEEAGDGGIMTGTPMPYAFLFDATPPCPSSSSSCAAAAGVSGATVYSVEPLPTTTTSSSSLSSFFPPGWVSHTTKEILQATVGVLSEASTRAHLAYFLAALVHPSYITYRLHTLEQQQWQKEEEEAAAAVGGGGRSSVPPPPPSGHKKQRVTFQKGRSIESTWKPWKRRIGSLFFRILA